MLRVIGPILQKHRLTSNIAEKGSQVSETVFTQFYCFV